MKKKTLLSVLMISIFAISLFASRQAVSLAGERYKDKPYFKEVEKLKLAKKKGIFNLNIDLQLGANISSTTFEFNKVDTVTNMLSSSTTKVGPAVGLIFSVDFLGFGFTSGFLYSSKGFKQTDGTKSSLNYFNIPLLFYFDFEAGKVIIDGNVGPYFGLLLSQDPNAVSNVKNFDFGLTGNIQGAYMINKYIGPLLGLKYEYGGLNNLQSTETVKRVTTQTFFIYTGVKFVL